MLAAPGRSLTLRICQKLVTPDNFRISVFRLPVKWRELLPETLRRTASIQPDRALIEEF